jgi:hypothetical protein
MECHRQLATFTRVSLDFEMFAILGDRVGKIRWIGKNYWKFNKDLREFYGDFRKGFYGIFVGLK